MTSVLAGRPGTDGDAVAGVVPAQVVRPTTADEVVDVLRDGTGTVVPVGGRTKTGWAAPPTSCDLALDLTGLDRVVETGVMTRAPAVAPPPACPAGRPDGRAGARNTRVCGCDDLHRPDGYRRAAAGG